MQWARNTEILFRCPVSMSCFDILFRYSVSMSCFDILFRYPVSMSCFDVLFLYPVSMSCFYILFRFPVSMSCFDVLFLYPVSMSCFDAQMIHSAGVVIVKHILETRAWYLLRASRHGGKAVPCRNYVRLCFLHAHARRQHTKSNHKKSINNMLEHFGCVGTASKLHGEPGKRHMSCCSCLCCCCAFPAFYSLTLLQLYWSVGRYCIIRW